MSGENINVFDPILHPDLKNVLDRSAVRPQIERVYFEDGGFSQGADLNDAFSIEARRRTDIGNLIAKDGDRQRGADVVVDKDAGTVRVTDGTVYIQGALRAIAGALLTGVPMTGDVRIGARAIQTVIRGADDGIFLGQSPDAVESYGEEGAIRTRIDWSWGHDQDGISGQFFPYVLIRNGGLISQDAPPTLSGVQQQIAVYDYDSHENYVVRGCQVSAIGRQAGAQVFAIAEGTANILGFKVQRPFATRHIETEAPDLSIVDAEAHTFDDGGTGTAVIPLRHSPMAHINSVIITKQRTVTLIKGPPNGADALPDDSVTAITLVKQGGTTYVATTSYLLNNDTVDWAPGGAEPATGSSYDVTYRYLDAQPIISSTDTSITVSDGVTGGQVLIGYDYKLPRVDRICLDKNGNVVYLKGLSAPVQPQPPGVPKSVVNLARIENTWFGTPNVINDADIAVPVALERRMYNKLLDTLNQVTLLRQQMDINVRASGSQLGMFSDPLTSDYYRDAGEVQNGAVFGGSFQIPITPTFRNVSLPQQLMLDYSDTISIRQELVSSCVKINPYQSFSPLPGALKITPAKDYWTEEQTVWLSPETRVFGAGNQERVVDVDVLEDTQTAPLRYLRQIPVDYVISGFGAGEVLTSLTFDGINVLSSTVAANGLGVISGNFIIPPKVTAGRKQVRAQSAAGTVCVATFEGQGRIETIQLRQVTTVERFQAVQPRRVEIGRGSDGRAGGSPDPQAQSFTFTEGRHVTGIDLRFCSIGDRNNPVIIEAVTVENGFPTTQIIAQTEIDMHAVVVNQWTPFNFQVPFYLPPGQMFAFVVKTNDPNHSISAADRGQFDAAQQKWIAAQPYTIGTRFSSSNAISWTVHQDSDLTFRIRTAVFSPTTKIVNLGNFNVVNCSDLIIRSDVFLPEDSCTVVFEVDFGTEPTIRILPDQVYERTSYFTGQIKVRAVLKGNARVSPVIDRDILMIFGEMKASGTYISRAFKIGTSVDMHSVMATKLPPGSSLQVYVDAGDDNWQAMTQVSALTLESGFIERDFGKNPFSAPTGGRLKLVLQGGPAARPSVADLRGYSI